jgi:hypothetical protein
MAWAHSVVSVAVAQVEQVEVAAAAALRSVAVWVVGVELSAWEVVR